jgi:hypothetical protein
MDHLVPNFFQVLDQLGLDQVRWFKKKTDWIRLEFKFRINWMDLKYRIKLSSPLTKKSTFMILLNEMIFELFNEWFYDDALWLVITTSRRSVSLIKIMMLQLKVIQLISSISLASRQYWRKQRMCFFFPFPFSFLLFFWKIACAALF